MSSKVLFCRDFLCYARHAFLTENRQSIPAEPLFHWGLGLLLVSCMPLSGATQWTPGTLSTGGGIH